MTSISSQLNAYLALRQQQTGEAQQALRILHDQIAAQVEEFRQQEQVNLDAQTTVLDSIRPLVQEDARCLLATPEFEQFLTQLTQGSRWYLNYFTPPLAVTSTPTTWLLATQPLPLVIVSHEKIRDDSAYNDENHYTDYRCQLAVQLGTWQKTIDASVVSLDPGNPIRVSIKGLSSQHYDLAYRLLKAEQYSREPVTKPDFPELSLTDEQETQLKQEMSYLLTFVGDLLTTHEWAEYFRYPQRFDIQNG